MSLLFITISGLTLSAMESHSPNISEETIVASQVKESQFSHLSVASTYIRVETTCGVDGMIIVQDGDTANDVQLMISEVKRMACPY